MSLFKKSKVAKVTAGVVGFASAIFMLGGVAVMPAQAQTVDELAAQIQSLLATISALQAQLATLQGGGSTTTTACTFTRNLTLEASGSDVTCLQDYLTGTGHFTFSGGSTGYFGPVTKAAVAAWQADNDVSPAVGYFGPISMAKYESLASTVVVTPPVDTGDNGDGTVVTPPAPVGTGLTVSSPLQPAASLAPQSAARLPFTKVTFTAGADGDVTVDSIVVERTGLATDSNFSGIVILDENGTQLGVKKTLNSIHQATLTEDFVVKAGQSRTMTIAGNMAADLSNYAGQVAGLDVVAVNTSATVSGSLPITGALHTINATLAIGSVTLQRGSTDPGANQDKEVGTNNYTFSAIRVTAGSAEKVYLKSIRWNQTGSAGKDDLENVKTYVDGTAYDTSVSSDGKYYTAVFGNGLLIDKGFSKELSIKGDITGGSNRTVTFDIAKKTDLDLVGELFGYGITPPQTGDSSSPGVSAFSSAEDPWYNASTVTVSTGSLTISSDTAVAAQNIAVNVQDQPLGGFIVDVKGEAISVAQMVFYAMATGDQVSDITNVTLVDQNGSVVAGPVDGEDTTDPAGKFTFSDTVTFPVGVTKLVLKGKLGTTFVSNDSFQASTTPGTDWTSVTGQVTGNSITPSPSSAITALTMTVKAGALAISQSSQPVAQSVISGAQQFEFARYILDASQSGEDVRMTTFIANLVAKGTNGTHLTNCQLYDGSTSLTTGSNAVNPTDATGDKTFTFDGTGLIIPKGTSKTISLQCNLSTSASGDYTWGLTDNSGGSLYTSATGMTSGQTIAETMTTGAGIAMTAAANGSYTVAKDSSSAYDYKAVVAGTSDVPLAAFKFTAGITEDINLKQIALQMANTASSAPNDLLDGKVTLWHNGVKVGEAQFGLSNADYATSSAISIPITKGETEVIVVKGTLSNQTVSTNTTSTADNGGYGAFVGITYDGNNVGLNGNYATGADSGANISSGTTSDVTTNGVRIFRNVPSIALTSSSNNNISVGSELLKFRVTNPGSRDLILKKFKFGIATSGGSFTGFTLKGDGVAANDSVAEVTGASATNSGVLTITFETGTNAKVVSANSFKDYVLTNTGITDAGASAVETISITLKADSAFAVASNYLMGTVAELSAYNIIWSPVSTTSPTADSASESNLDWTNGYGLPGFPAPGSDMPSQSFTRQ